MAFSAAPTPPSPLQPYLYDLVVFVDDTHPCPPPTLTTANNPTPNPVYSLWVRQDQLILNVIIDSITPTLIPFIATATTSQVAWTTLLNTYLIKMCNDELLLMNAAYDIDKLTLKILRGLSDEYSSLAFTVKARETLVFFDKLHEKLITYEAQLKQDQDKKLLTGASAYLAIKNPNTSSHHNYKANSYRCNVSSNNRHLPASPHQTHPPTSQTLPGFLLALWY
ncbi:hypothetical protein VitviT2T_012190 [Vitis vinifera]|uniref:Retrovirus-related Pol polyprotein from transposon RE1 n=2 Tax=Vitis vinifera TaxID=29760 RepID=A0ABY9CFF9_VITVI|nr:Retrovirus-related Pol polyprotein from transposon RE2 [Vitis vinifera]WJZ93234.1 hypothetical protein VitviT2T_012190 [Vitis vinifera]